MASSTATPDSMITIKALYEGETRRFRIPLRDMNVNTLPGKV